MSRARNHPRGEDGYMLLAVVIMAALVLIALAVAAPVVARDLRRDKEVESEHRAEQYVRAIRLYYLKNKAYPPSIKALEGTNNIRYLRQEYVDPLTGQSNWRLIHLGEQKTTIKGFFGQELAGLPAGGLGSAAGMSSGIGSSVAGASAGTSTGSASGGTATTTVSTTNALNAGFGGSQIGGSTGTATAGSTTGGLASGFGSSDSSTGGPIVGVGTAKTGTSIAQPNGQATYETWEFWYDPRIEALRKNVNILGGGMTSQAASSFGSDAASGQSNSGSTTGTGLNGSGSTGTTSTGAGSTGTGTGTTGVSTGPK